MVLSLEERGKSHILHNVQVMSLIMHSVTSIFTHCLQLLIVTSFEKVQCNRTAGVCKCECECECRTREGCSR